jgi:hypothetical protein
MSRWARGAAPKIDGWFTAICGTPYNLWSSKVDMNGIEHEYGWTTSWHRC